MRGIQAPAVARAVARQGGLARRERIEGQGLLGCSVFLSLALGSHGLALGDSVSVSLLDLGGKTILPFLPLPLEILLPLLDGRFCRRRFSQKGCALLLALELSRRRAHHPEPIGAQDPANIIRT